ncbi:MAG: ArgE/DapE family deacylase [Thermodesulfobacteriota bacterium]
MDVERAILSQADRTADQAVAFLTRLVRIESITGQEGPIQDEVVRVLEEMGLELDVWEPDPEELKGHPLAAPVKSDFKDRPIVVGRWPGRGRGRSLLLNGHVDVVQPGSGWRHDPFGGEIEAGRLYGRGASDMKGGVAAMVMALRVLKDLNLNPKADILVQTVVDEENGINGSLAGLLRGHTAEACLNCEASDLEVQPAHSGIMEYFLHVYGQPTPISRKDDSISPIEKGFRLVQAMTDLESSLRVTHHHPLFPPRSMNIYVTSFHAGLQTTVLPDEAVIGGMVRLLPGMEAEETRRLVEEYVANVAALDPFLRQRPPRFRWQGLFAESMQVPEGHPWVECLKASFLAATGRPARISGHEGACDPWIINNHGRIPTVIFGPGRITQMHAVDEYVELQDLITAIKTMALAIHQWSFVEGAA